MADSQHTTNPHKHNFIDLTGQKFGRLTVVKYHGRVHGQSQWECICECGNKTIVYRRGLIKQETRSCGCLAKECVRQRATCHGHSSHPLYNQWKAMINRCESKRSISYPNYGARGIVVCDRWRDFALFVADMEERPFPGASIERIDNDGPYSPENCRWASQQEQSLNKRNNHRYEFNGHSRTLPEWARIVGIKRSTLQMRILTYKWTVERALTTPVISNR